MNSKELLFLLLGISLVACELSPQRSQDPPKWGNSFDNPTGNATDSFGSGGNLGSGSGGGNSGSGGSSGGSGGSSGGSGTLGSGAGGGGGSSGDGGGGSNGSGTGPGGGDTGVTYSNDSDNGTGYNLTQSYLSAGQTAILSGTAVLLRIKQDVSTLLGNYSGLASGSSADSDVVRFNKNLKVIRVARFGPINNPNDSNEFIQSGYKTCGALNSAVDKNFKDFEPTDFPVKDGIFEFKFIDGDNDGDGLQTIGDMLTNQVGGSPTAAMLLQEGKFYIYNICLGSLLVTDPTHYNFFHQAFFYAFTADLHPPRTPQSATASSCNVIDGRTYNLHLNLSFPHVGAASRQGDGSLKGINIFAVPGMSTDAVPIAFTSNSQAALNRSGFTPTPLRSYGSDSQTLSSFKNLDQVGIDISGIPVSTASGANKRTAIALGICDNSYSLTALEDNYPLSKLIGSNSMATLVDLEPYDPSNLNCHYVKGWIDDSGGSTCSAHLEP